MDLTAEFLAQYKAGNQGAHTLVYQHYQGKIFRTIIRMVKDEQIAAELTQETFLKSIEHAKSFNTRYQLSTWLYRIAQNLAISHLRRKRNRRYTNYTEEGGYIGNSSRVASLNPHIEPYDAAMIAELLHAFSKLSPKEQLLLELQFKGMTFEEVAHELNCPVANTTKTQTIRARAKMRALMPDYVRRIP